MKTGHLKDIRARVRPSVISRTFSTISAIKSTRTGALGLGIVVSLLSLSIIAPIFIPYDPIKGSITDSLKPPSLSHPLGTDELGRDLLTRILYGIRNSLLVAVLGTSVGAILGVLLGLISGYLGGSADFVIMRLADALLSIPSILIAIALVALTGPGLWNIVIALTLGILPIYIRLIRGTVIQVKNIEYVIAAKLMGLSSFRIMYKHILPNIAYIIVSQYTLDLGGSILMASGLGFLGLGIQPPTPELGTMIGTAKNYLAVAPGLVFYPGLALILLVLGFNLLGNAIRDTFDPNAVMSR